jgi:Arc/MetJ-type ribon-helix-helix transcriptional regulator
MEFVIPPAATKYGHSASVSIKLTPEMMREIQAFVQSGKFPYRTNSDLIRHSLHLHLRALADLEPGVANTDVTDVLMAITRQETEAERWLKAIQDGAEVLDSHLRKGEFEDAKRFYQQLYGVCYDMPSGEMQAKALEVLGRYDHLRVMSPISMRPSEAV